MLLLGSTFLKYPLNKAVYVLLDGIGDRPHHDLNGVTPLESAYTPNLDSLVLQGAMGLVTTVGENIPPESDVAVFSMLGYDVRESYVGRGAIEAIGSEMDFENGKLALRGNFASASNSGEIIDRRSGRNLTSQEASELAAAVNNNVKLDDGATFDLVHTVGHRSVLMFSHPKISLSSDISNTDPAYERIGSMGVAREKIEKMKISESKPMKADDASRTSAALVNEFTEKSLSILQNHPVNQDRQRDGKLRANSILLRDASNRLPNEEKLSAKFGRSFACIADMPAEVGIGKITGMHLVTSSNSSSYSSKATETAKLSEKFDVVYVHLKGPDEPGHDGNALLKKKIIEEIDSQFFGILLKELASKEVVYAITGDHSTPCSLKAHSSDPVPLLITSSKISTDDSIKFTESNAENGSLGMMQGVDVLSTVLSYT